MLGIQLKQKSEMYERFMQWKVLVEKSIGYNLKTLCTDNGACTV